MMLMVYLLVMEKIVLNYRNPKTFRIIPRRDLFFLKEHYDKLRDFILLSLVDQSYLSLSELMDKAQELDPREFTTDNIIVPLLLVKSDLEARGVIKVSFEVNHTQRIEIKNKNLLFQLRNNSCVVAIAIIYFFKPINS